MQSGVEEADRLGQRQHHMGDVTCVCTHNVYKVSGKQMAGNSATVCRCTGAEVRVR